MRKKAVGSALRRWLIPVLLVGMMPALAGATSYVNLGVSRVDFYADAFDRKYEVDKTLYNHMEFSTNVRDIFSLSGVLQADPDSKDIENAYIRLGLKSHFIGYMTGEINGEIVHDSGKKMGTFESSYTHFYIGKLKGGFDDLRADQVNIDNGHITGLAYTKYSMPYLFTVGTKGGNEVPAIQDNDLKLQSLGLLIEYDPVRAKTIALQNHGGDPINDWYFNTHMVLGVTYAEMGDGARKALDTSDAKWWGIGMPSAHYELGWLYAKKRGNLTYSFQVGCFLRVHLMNMVPPWELFDDLDEGELEPPVIMHLLYGPLAKVTVAW